MKRLILNAVFFSVAMVASLSASAESMDIICENSVYLLEMDFVEDGGMGARITAKDGSFTTTVDYNPEGEDQTIWGHYNPDSKVLAASFYLPNQWIMLTGSNVPNAKNETFTAFVGRGDQLSLRSPLAFNAINTAPKLSCQFSTIEGY